MRITIIAVIALLIGVAGPAAALDIEQQRIIVRDGKLKSVSGRIRGFEMIDYKFDAPGGARLTISMSSSNPSSYFNLYGPIGADGMPDQSIFTGSSEGNKFVGTVPSSGEYVVRVYMMRNAARRDEVAKYKLSVGTNLSKRQQPDFADGLAGGPDYWRVVGVPAGDTLIIRSQPSARSAIVSRARNGDVLRNGGCRMNGSTRWCKVTTRGGQTQGWASGKFLRE